MVKSSQFGRKGLTTFAICIQNDVFIPPYSHVLLILIHCIPPHLCPCCLHCCFCHPGCIPHCLLILFCLWPALHTTKAHQKFLIQALNIYRPYAMQLVAPSCAGLGWWVPTQTRMANFQLSKLLRVVHPASFSENSFICLYRVNIHM